MLLDQLNNISEQATNAINNLLNPSDNSNVSQGSGSGLEGLGELNIGKHSGIVQLPNDYLYKFDSDSRKFPMDYTSVNTIEKFENNIMSFLSKLNTFKISRVNDESIGSYIECRYTDTEFTVDDLGNKVFPETIFLIHPVLNNEQLQEVMSRVLKFQCNNAVPVIFSMSICTPELRLRAKMNNIQIIDYEDLGEINVTFDKSAETIYMKSVLALTKNSIKACIFKSVANSKRQ
jgi:hypothetical protein